MSKLALTLIQSDLLWEDNQANQQQMDRLIAQLNDTDIILLPEMWNTAFSSRSKVLSQPMDGDAVRSMQRWAKERDAVVAGSIMIQESGTYYNRMLWVRPDGTITTYDKRHLFRMAGEDANFESGQERVIVEYKGWRIMLQICYDLRFPVFARNGYRNGAYDYDLIIYAANWPTPRHNAWETLLRARAMENLAYCAGVNRVGTDANGLQFKGGSAVLDYLGNPLVDAGAEPGIVQTTIDLDLLHMFREKFPTGMDADGFELVD